MELHRPAFLVAGQSWELMLNARRRVAAQHRLS